MAANWKCNYSLLAGFETFLTKGPFPIFAVIYNLICMVHLPCLTGSRDLHCPYIKACAWSINWKLLVNIFTNSVIGKYYFPATCCGMVRCGNLEYDVTFASYWSTQFICSLPVVARNLGEVCRSKHTTVLPTWSNMADYFSVNCKISEEIFLFFPQVSMFANEMCACMWMEI